MKVISRYFLCVVFLFILANVTSAFAKSVESPPVKGREPVAQYVQLSGPTAPFSGDILRLTANFLDLDGDDEFGSTIKWYRDGDVIPNANQSVYLIQDDDIGKDITAGYLPATDENITDPHLGEETVSNSILIKSGKPVATSSTLILDKDTIFASGSIDDGATITLTLKDSRGNPVDGIASRLDMSYISSDGIDDVIVGENELGNGVYEYKITGSKSGTVIFTPMLDGSHLNTTPETVSINLTGNATTAMIKSGDLVITKNNAVADDSEVNIVQVKVTDDNERPVKNVNVSFTTTNPAEIIASSALTDINGVVTASVKSSRAGFVAVNAVINSTGSQQSINLNFVAGLPSSQSSELDVSNASIVANGGLSMAGQSILTLALKDVKGNPISGKTVCFPVSGTASIGVIGIIEGCLPAIESQTSGIYTATLSGTKAGSLSVGSSVNGNIFTATPESVVMNFTPWYVVSSLTSTTNIAKANNSDIKVLTAIVKDKADNPVNAATVMWEVDDPSAILSSSNTITNAQGMSSVTVRSKIAKAINIKAKVSGNVEDLGLTAQASFEVYPVVSSIRNSGSSAVNNSPADGLTPNVIVIQITDLAGNPIKNSNAGQISLNFSGTTLGTGPASLKLQTSGSSVSSSSTSQAVVTDGDGQVILTAINNVAENIHISAKVSTSTEAAVTQSSTFIIYPLLNSLVASTATSENNVPANNTSLNKVIATITDKKGNPLANKPVTLTFSQNGSKTSFAGSNGPGVCATSPCSVATDASGKVTISLKDYGNAVTTATVQGYAQSSAIDQKTASVNFNTYSISNISVNGTNNNAAMWLPTTGFTGAKFQLRMNNTFIWNGDYTWSSSQPWANVDASGNVTFTGVASTENKSVTITATPKGGIAPAQTWSFTLNHWFTNAGSAVGNRNDAFTYCNNAGLSVPHETLGVRLYSEWKNLINYQGAGWTNTGSPQGQDYWLSDGSILSIYLDSGNVFRNNSYVILHMFCYKAL
ncbi:hypothetical protein GL270_09300 [Aeromonas veronii]|uniref:Ig-like domain-containing protein n=1 Tax=Aeromonas veronii TaxID=654 RepID=UPI001C5B7FDA|nr:Ig-like domain-containing protein [Aeromonas veronii]MBW3781442.1 hypothetical protein [Aeromonas veronii]